MQMLRCTFCSFTSRCCCRWLFGFLKLRVCCRVSPLVPPSFLLCPFLSPCLCLLLPLSVSSVSCPRFFSHCFSSSHLLIRFLFVLFYFTAVVFFLPPPSPPIPSRYWSLFAYLLLLFTFFRPFFFCNSSEIPLLLLFVSFVYLFTDWSTNLLTLLSVCEV